MRACMGMHGLATGTHAARSGPAKLSHPHHFTGLSPNSGATMGTFGSVGRKPRQFFQFGGLIPINTPKGISRYTLATSNISLCAN